MKGVEWLGDSQQVFRDFPEEVHDYLGYAIRQVQQGDYPACAKPLAEVGPGIYELKKRHRRVAYRVAYIAKLDSYVYVLHCFTKDAREGIRTRDREIRVIRQRYRELMRQV